MDVLKYPSPELFVVCKEVMVFGPELKVLLESMWDTMKENKGLGLAANQVGLEYRMCVMQGPKEEKLFLVNPKILKVSKGTYDYAEGCLSAPGQYLKLFRPAWATVAFQNEDGHNFVKTFSGIFSVCVQHEMDHLDGKSHLENKTIPKRTRIMLAKKWGFKVK